MINFLKVPWTQHRIPMHGDFSSIGQSTSWIIVLPLHIDKVKIQSICLRPHEGTDLLLCAHGGECSRAVIICWPCPEALQGCPASPTFIKCKVKVVLLLQIQLGYKNGFVAVCILCGVCVHLRVWSPIQILAQSAWWSTSPSFLYPLTPSALPSSLAPSSSLPSSPSNSSSPPSLSLTLAPLAPTLIPPLAILLAHCIHHYCSWLN